MNPPEISVITPIDQAFERVKQVLFRPFDLGRWFVIGFCAWLALLGEGGFNFNFNLGGRNQGNVDLQTGLEHAREYVAANLVWIVPLAIVLIACGLCLGVLFTWLRSRGTFMFLHCVATNRAEVVVPWRRFRRQGNSLFWFRLILGLSQFAASVPLLVPAGLRAYRMAVNGDWPASGILTLVAFGLALLALSIVFAIIDKLAVDFVAPIMFLRGGLCLEGWRELLPLLAARLGAFVLYILFQILMAIAIGIGLLVAVLITCCLAACLLVLPYLGTVALLPVLVFKRAYSLHYFAQFGPEFDAFRPPVPPVVPPPSTAPPGNGAAGI